MPSEPLMCVWESCLAKDSSPDPSSRMGLPSSILREVLMCLGNLDGVCLLLNEEKIDKFFPDETVDFADFKRIFNDEIRQPKYSLQQLEIDVADLCWSHCRQKYEGTYRLGQNHMKMLWLVFVKICESGTYPARVNVHEMRWLIEKVGTILGRQTSRIEISDDGMTFAQLLHIMDSHFFQGDDLARIYSCVEDLYNWLVLEMSHVGWMWKRTRRQSNWTNWQKRWFILTNGKLTYYTNSDLREMKNQVAVTSYSLLEVVPDYRSLPWRKLTGVFRLTNSPGLEIDMSAGNDRDRTLWMDAIEDMIEAAKKGMSPIQYLLQERVMARGKNKDVFEYNGKLDRFRQTVYKARQSVLQLPSHNNKPNKADLIPLTVENQSDDFNEKPLDVPVSPSLTKIPKSVNGPESATPITRNLNAITLANDASEQGNSGKLSLTCPIPMLNAEAPAMMENDDELFDNNMLTVQQDKIKNIFVKFDMDGDGYINQSEFEYFLKEMGLDMNHRDMRVIFRTIDDNGDEKIQFSEFLSYFIEMVAESESGKTSESTLKQAFLAADSDGTGTVDFREFTEYVTEHRRSVRVSQLLGAFNSLTGNDDVLTFKQFKSLFDTNDPAIKHIMKSSSNKSEDLALEQHLKNLYNEADMDELTNHLLSRWKSFASFKRKGASGDMVMEGGHGLVSDVVPGTYSLLDLACFADLPQIEPKHVVVRDFRWVSCEKGNAHGMAIFPDCFDRHVPVDVATDGHLAYYDCSLADANGEKVSLLYRHAIQDFTYQNKYLDDFVTHPDENAGSGIEKHDFTHLDCPLDEESGIFVLGKIFPDNELHLTGFKVPRRHTLYIPGGVIHTNDYLCGTWRTMLSDETDIDHVHLHRKRGAFTEKFTFIFDQ